MSSDCIITDETYPFRWLLVQINRDNNIITKISDLRVYLKDVKAIHSPASDPKAEALLIISYIRLVKTWCGLRETNYQQSLSSGNQKYTNYLKHPNLMHDKANFLQLERRS